jgi:aerobic carbon-monoxide dehydrogenase medium subunit
VKPPELDYAAPQTLDEAARLLAGTPEAKVLAGGQSLMPLLNFRLAAPPLLVDLARVPGLGGVERSNGAFAIGAMVRQRRAERDRSLTEAVPLLREALRHVAHPQIRSRGTVCGSVAHADPAAELPAVLVALDGRVRVHGPGGSERAVEARELYASYFTTTLEPEEIVTAVELPVAAPRTGAACVEVARRAGDYALCGALAQVTLDPGGAVADARVALFGVGATPVRASAVEEALRGERPDAERLAGAAARAADGLEPPDDMQASADYRRHLARVLSRRALTAASAEAERA